MNNRQANFQPSARGTASCGPIRRSAAISSSSNTRAWCSTLATPVTSAHHRAPFNAGFVPSGPISVLFPNASTSLFGRGPQGVAGLFGVTAYVDPNNNNQPFCWGFFNANDQGGSTPSHSPATATSHCVSTRTPTVAPRRTTRSTTSSCR